MARNSEPAHIVRPHGQWTSGIEVMERRFVFSRVAIHPVLIRKYRRCRGFLNAGLPIEGKGIAARLAVLNWYYRIAVGSMASVALAQRRGSQVRQVIDLSDVVIRFIHVPNNRCWAII